jgi:hypothetical protein
MVKISIVYVEESKRIKARCGDANTELIHYFIIANQFVLCNIIGFLSIVSLFLGFNTLLFRQSLSIFKYLTLLSDSVANNWVSQENHSAYEFILPLYADSTNIIT